MAYRETPKIAARKQYIREKILRSAAELTAELGFSGTSVSAIAARAGVATGSVYRYFPNKSALCTEVFRAATTKEVEQVKLALAAPGNVSIRLQEAVSTFADRALRSRRLAYSLIAEPVDPQLDQERLNYREHYTNLFAATIQEGIESKDLCPQNPRISGAALVGALAEALIGPLATLIRENTAETFNSEHQCSEQQMINEITAFCLRAVGVVSMPPAKKERSN